MTRRYMLDTVVFNQVVDGKIDASMLADKSLVATHIQRDEICRTKDASRREALQHLFVGLIHEEGGGELLRTESAFWGVSTWDESKWTEGDGLVEKLRAELDLRNKKKASNAADVLIAETALKNKCVLVTADADLFSVVTKFGGACQNLFALTSE